MRKTEIAERTFKRVEMNLRPFIGWRGDELALALQKGDTSELIMKSTIEIMTRQIAIIGAIQDLAEAHQYMAASLRDIYDKLSSMDHKKL